MNKSDQQDQPAPDPPAPAEDPAAPPVSDPTPAPAEPEDPVAEGIAQAQIEAVSSPEETSGDRTRLTGELEIARQHAIAAAADARDAAAEAELAAELEAKVLAELA